MSTYNNKYDILGSTIKPNPASVKYWADLASNPNGGDLKYFNGKDWVYVNNTATSDIKDLRSDLTSEISRATGRENEIEAKIDALIGDAPEIMDSLPELIDVINTHAELIEGKVDRQPGKDLSTNDYTTAEKNKLAGIAANANNYTLPTASDSTLGGIKTGFVSTDTKKAVKVQDGKAYVEIDSTNIEINDIPNAESFYSYGVSWQTGSLNATFTYACRKNKGIHKAAQDIKKVLRKDVVNTQYCLKLDIKKFYPSIDHEILKSIVRRKIKDTRVLKLLDEIIDSAPGVPIGNYLSQYFANLYLAYFDHWIKECKKIKYYFRYADDIVIFSKDKRGLDFVGYKFYHTHTLLRKNIKYNMCKCLSRLYNKTYSKSYARRKVCSYFGWLKFCNSINFCKKLVLRVCKKYNLTTPEIFVPKKDIISNVLNRKLKFIGYKIYNKYFKLYVITNKLISVTSKSKLLLSLLIRDIINTYIIIIFHKRYNAYEILL